MDTKIIQWNKETGYKIEELQEACEVLKKGGLVAFPTETVYGLGGNALDPSASQKIYEAKGRPSDNPLIVHIYSIKQLYDLVEQVPQQAMRCAMKFWPGPLTMIFKKEECVPEKTTGGLSTVAIRMPAHPAALELLRTSQICIAAPSANTSGRPSPTKVEHVIEDMQGKIPIIINGDASSIGIESTIVDFTGEIPTILRPGYITKEMLREVIGEIQVDPALENGLTSDEKPKAPGMKYKHYAPKGEMTIFTGNIKNVINEINKRIDLLKGEKVGVIATEETMRFYHNAHVICIGSRDDEDHIAREIYGALRELDQNNIKYIFSESFENSRLGGAIMNRLRKAASHQIVYCGDGGIVE